jgi:hypothetical protein
MPRSSKLQTNFTAGELSSNVDARTNFERYFNGSSILENFVILPQGPIFKRKGFRFIAETKDSTKKSRIIEFEFSSLQTYAIEMGEGYFRFFSQQARILEDPITITGATQANPVVITATAHGYNNGDLVVIEDIGGMTEINNKEFTVANQTANTFELQGIDGTGFTAYTSGGTSSKVHEITNPYLEAELFDVKFVQDSDVIYFMHPLHPIQKLIRIAGNQFTLTEVDLIKGPYVEENIISVDVLTLTGGAPWTEGSTLTLTASGGFTPFTSDHVGGLWKLTSGTDIAHLEVSGFTSSTIVTVIAKNDVPASLQGVGVSTWSEGEFSNARSFPGAVSFHEQRLVLAGSLDAPQRLWFSKSNADYENFEAGTNADDPFNVKIAAQKGDPIRWLFSDNVLFIGTAAGIFRAISSRNGSALAINDVDVKLHISHGASSIQPELVGEFPFYVQRGLRKVRAVNFSIDQDKYSAKDITIDSDQITGTGLVQIDYQQNPIPTMLAIRADGQLAPVTSENDQDVLAWSRFVTQGKFESVAVVTNDSDQDDIYIIVNRTINGVTKRFVEAQEPNFLIDNLNAFYVDSGLTYNGTKFTNLTLSSGSGSFSLVTEDEAMLITEDGFALITEEEDISFMSDSPIFTQSDVGNEIHEVDGNGGNGRAIIISFISSTEVVVDVIEAFSKSSLDSGKWAIAIKTIFGLDHLIGENVYILSDGATEGSQEKIKTVDSQGSVSIDSAGSIIHVGLGYNPIQTNMPMEVSNLSQVIGSSQGKDKRIDRVTIRFKDTRGGEVISDNDTIPIPFRSLNDNMNETVPVFNEDLDVVIASDWDKPGLVTVTQTEPQPMMLKSITYKVTVNDK